MHSHESQIFDRLCCFVADVDDYTLLREVWDVSALREGDHCVVGVNLLHKVSAWSDRLCSLLTSWGLVPFFHHFVLVDSVARVSATGLPLREDGGPCRVVEFSDTPMGALKRISADGLSPRALITNVLGVLQAPAKLHLPPLNDYLGLDGRGVFVVFEKLSVEQRRRTVNAAMALVDDAKAHPPYRVFSNNCEHLVSSIRATGNRSVCPQVSHNLWMGFRIILQILALFWLYLMHATPHEYTWSHALAATHYHLLSTVPTAAQTQVSLIRTCVNLTQRRSAGQISQVCPCHVSTIGARVPLAQPAHL